MSGAPLGSSVGGETADVERRNQQLHILVGIFVIKILKRNHLLGLDVRSEPNEEFSVLCPSLRGTREVFKPHVRLRSTS